MEESLEKFILVVEDDPNMRQILKDKFESSGFEVNCARNGQEAVDLAFKKHPDLIILDIIMPQKDGLAALEEIRRDAWGVNVPIIILTNVNEKSMLVKALEMGIDDYLVKAETKLSGLVDKVKSVLGIF